MAIPSGYSLLGRIGYNDRGVYTESSDYVRGDVVYHEGSSYVALTTVTGVTPADDNTNWKYLARGFGATELSEIDATDTSGFAGDAGKKVKGQTLIDKIAEYVMSKVVATDAFQTYLQKFLVDNCVTERSDLSLSAAQGKALQDQLATLNSNLTRKYYSINSQLSKPILEVYGNICVLQYCNAIWTSSDHIPSGFYPKILANIWTPVSSSDDLNTANEYRICIQSNGAVVLQKNGNNVSDNTSIRGQAVWII